MPPSVIMLICRPVGMPRRHRCSRMAGSVFQSAFVSCTNGSRHRERRQSRNAINCASTVANEAPKMPQPKPITNSRSSAILAKLAAIIANSGVLLSPRQRSTAAAMLYAMMMSEPPNCTYKYVCAPPNTAGSVCSSVSRGLTSSRLVIVTAMPNQHDSLTIIASTRRSRSYAPAPNSCAARIAKPCVKPCSPHKTSQLIQSAAPMDASACMPTPRPMMIVSTIVYSC